MLTTCKSNSTKMGAVDPIIARNHVKLKSASIEAGNQPNARTTARNKHEVYETPETTSTAMGFDIGHQRQTDNSQQSTEKQFLALSPAPLKPSVSTSCLLTTEDTNASNALVCIPTRASLTHEWKKLMTPNKCRECNLLVYFNGRECSFCGFVAHKKCVTILVIKCSGQQVSDLVAKNRKERQARAVVNHDSAQQASRKAKPTIQPIFGQPISTDSHQVVDFIRRFIYEIDTRGLTSKGIYRVSSIKSKVDRLCNYYDQNLSSLVDLSSFHPNIIANSLKMYLRQLPEPLLTHQLYNKFIEIAKKYSNTQQSPSASPTALEPCKESNLSTKQSSLARHVKPYSLAVSSTTVSSVFNNPDYDPMLIVEMQEIIELLPPINRDLIAIIMRHLKRVAEMSDENQMSAKNLSIIFGPTLLTANNKSLAIVDNIHQARVVELMVTWADQIFPQYENYESNASIELDFPDLTQHAQKIGQERLTDNNNNESQDGGIIRRTGRRPKNDTQPRKTRKDLRELRRQFFTVPSVQNLVPVESTTSDQNQVELRKSNKSHKPAGSLPVIKVQPCYCNTLTRLAGEKF